MKVKSAKALKREKARSLYSNYQKDKNGPEKRKKWITLIEIAAENDFMLKITYHKKSTEEKIVRDVAFYKGVNLVDGDVLLYGTHFHRKSFLNTRSYLLSRIISIKILDIKFKPIWKVEL